MTVIIKNTHSDVKITAAMPNMFHCRNCHLLPSEMNAQVLMLQQDYMVVLRMIWYMEVVVNVHIVFVKLEMKWEIYKQPMNTLNGMNLILMVMDQIKPVIIVHAQKMNQMV